MRLSTFVLMYGEYPKLHETIINDIMTRLPKEQLSDVHIWCNRVCRPTIKRLLEQTPFNVYETPENYPKYPIMREMFLKADVKDWILWLDDDTRIEASDWFQKTAEYIESHKSENVCFVGPNWVCSDFNRRMQFLKESKWWRNRPLEMKNGGPICQFPIGGYWLLRNDVRKLIDWPDPRLSHNGGDTLLAEAVRQQGLPFHGFAYGIKTQTAPRRGLQEKPAGWDGKTVQVVQPTNYKMWIGQKKI